MKRIIVTLILLTGGSANACDLWPSARNGGETFQECQDRNSRAMREGRSTNYQNSYPTTHGPTSRHPDWRRDR